MYMINNDLIQGISIYLLFNRPQPAPSSGVGHLAIASGKHRKQEGFDIATSNCIGQSTLIIGHLSLFCYITCYFLVHYSTL